MEAVGFSWPSSGFRLRPRCGRQRVIDPPTRTSGRLKCVFIFVSLTKAWVGGIFRSAEAQLDSALRLALVGQSDLERARCFVPCGFRVSAMAWFIGTRVLFPIAPPRGADQPRASPHVLRYAAWYCGGAALAAYTHVPPARRVTPVNLEWYPTITLLPPLSLSGPVRSLPAPVAMRAVGSFQLT